MHSEELHIFDSRELWLHSFMQQANLFLKGPIKNCITKSTVVGERQVTFSLRISQEQRDRFKVHEVNVLIV